MRKLSCLAFVVALLSCVSTFAQDLDPRAYTRIPVDITLLVIGGAFSSGSVVTDPTLPLQDLHATVVSSTLGVGRTFSLFGQTAQIFVVQPYSWIDANATVNNEYQEVSRSGFADTRIRFSFLPIGAPAKTVSEFASVPSSTIIGASIMVIAPTGYYDPTKLINIGAHRWSFKPEIAISQPIADDWHLDVYAGLWLFTTNSTFYPGTSERTQDPMASFQGHVSYAFTKQMWAALNLTYYVGGNSYVNGIGKDDQQNNVRVGATMVVPVNNQHSIKVAASTGAIVRFGANFTTASMAWQIIL